ncbi:RpiR family transcriptional regulator [Planobispora rosea]|uniref:RpiR family transcriptional regulator n=1 Tax=Planobispora rosea TaxID=35762 RepID=A0A8J3WAC1_PLARO|nr:MurR/RpiR family transcriptional regulator [Planobispora rosea]GGS67957.1 RpiR family transcriptional regulator [Planobispora rosea]GIH81935.1 RpiR family transcriptional regulator [Planobispora rosea]
MELLSRIRAEQAEMPEALRKVAEVILADPAEAARSTIVDLAERSGTSTATITRLCRALGFGGYAELRVALATETGRVAQQPWETDIGQEILPDDGLDRVLSVVSGNDIRLIQETASQLDLATVEKVAGAIAQAGRVLLFGVSSSGAVASEMEYRLQRIRIPTWCRSDAHSALTDAALLGQGDVAIGISHSGRTREAIEVLAEAGSHGAITVAVTSHPRSPLAEVAELVVTTSSRETTFRAEGFAAIHSQLLVLDVIYVSVAQRTYERTRKAFDLTVRAVTGHRLPEGDT